MASIFVVEAVALERRPYDEMREMLVGRGRGYSVLDEALSILKPPDAEVPTLLRDVPMYDADVGPDALLPVPLDAEVTALPREVPICVAEPGAEVGAGVRLAGPCSSPFVLASVVLGTCSAAGTTDFVVGGASWALCGFCSRTGGIESTFSDTTGDFGASTTFCGRGRLSLCGLLVAGSFPRAFALMTGASSGTDSTALDVPSRSGFDVRLPCWLPE